jgi:AraC family transcriptional regulator
MKAALENYHARMQRVLDHIDQHLDDDLDLEALSGVAAFSKYHFHRQFMSTFGVSVHRYVQLARMKRASYRLAYRDAQSVTDIAMDAGYDAPDAFARAFRQRFGQSPSSFRKSPDWEPWLAAFGPFDNARSKLMQIIFTRRRDDPRCAPDAGGDHGASRRPGDARRHHPAVHRLAQGRRPVARDKPDLQHLPFREEPAVPADYSMDLCVGTDRPIEANDEQMKAGVIPGGRCAVLRVVPATPTIWSPPRSTFIATGFRPAARKHATSRSIAND